MSPLEATGAILAMGLVTYGTRIGGILLMSRITFSPRVEAFLRHLSGSVLIAVVVPPVIQSGPAAWVAVAAALIAMLTTRHTLLSLLIGMAAAAGYRALVG